LILGIIRGGFISLIRIERAERQKSQSKDKNSEDRKTRADKNVYPTILEADNPVIPKTEQGQTRMSAPPLEFQPVGDAISLAEAKSFVSHAKLIGALTFVSRVLGMARESVASYFFGAGAIWSAFTVAFTIPNLFRKLFGEGALSAAFIPLYAQQVKHQHPKEASQFAIASVNLLCTILIILTIVGEGTLWGMTLIWDMRPDRLLTVKLTAVMLPYVLLVCGTAFLGGILQVHRRFGATAAAPIILNLFLIIAILSAAHLWDLKTEAGQSRGVFWLSVTVLIAGVVQVLVLAPSLRAVGFRFQPVFHFWTPQVQRMLKLTIPVALGAGVLQLSVMLDKGLSLLLAQGHDSAGKPIEFFHLFGRWFRYPLAEGAAARLNWAQFMYQFPLGVFAIALATAIFPKLSSDAHELNQKEFKGILRRGLEACMFIGLPASAGLILVREPATRLLFLHGNFTTNDARLVALSTALYSSAIWAFSIQQILNRAYYALHDTITPLVLSIITLIVNLAVEIPLLWTGLAESGMAAGTAVSFAIQSVVMLHLLRRRVGLLGLTKSVKPVAKMIIATALMGIACIAIQNTPLYPRETVAHHKLTWAIQLTILMAVGGVVYLGACMAMGIAVLEHVRRKKATISSPSPAPATAAPRPRGPSPE
jgi:putative peptidoglycan lipid II flippase